MCDDHLPTDLLPGKEDSTSEAGYAMVLEVPVRIREGQPAGEPNQQRKRGRPRKVRGAGRVFGGKKERGTNEAVSRGEVGGRKNMGRGRGGRSGSLARKSRKTGGEVGDLVGEVKEITDSVSPELSVMVADITVMTDDAQPVEEPKKSRRRGRPRKVQAAEGVPGGKEEKGTNDGFPRQKIGGRKNAGRGRGAKIVSRAWKLRETDGEDGDGISQRQVGERKNVKRGRGRKIGSRPRKLRKADGEAGDLIGEVKENTPPVSPQLSVSQTANSSRKQRGRKERSNKLDAWLQVNGSMSGDNEPSLRKRRRKRVTRDEKAKEITSGGNFDHGETSKDVSGIVTRSKSCGGLKKLSYGGPKV